MGGGAGVGVAEPAETGDIAGQFDDALVVDVVQHRRKVPGLAGGSALGGEVSPSYIWTAMAEIQSGHAATNGLIGSQLLACGAKIRGLRRPAAIRPVCPVTLRS